MNIDRLCPTTTKINVGKNKRNNRLASSFLAYCSETVIHNSVWRRKRNAEKAG